MNMEQRNPDDASHETTNYDVILAQQSFSMRDITEHLTGPLIAIISHLILIPILLGIVIMPATEDKAGVEIKSVTEEITPLPEKPEELEEPEVTDPQESDVDRPETADVEEESTSIDDAELSEDMNSDEPPMIMMMDNQSNKTLKNVFIGRGGGGGRGGRGDKGFGSRGGRKEKATNFEGVLFDLKQTSGRGETAMAPNTKPARVAFGKALRDFVNSPDWSLENWSKQYYRCPEPVYTPCIYIPRVEAAEGPKAFECDKDVKPSRWVIVYKARLVAPKTGTFRLAGVGDDALVARVNKRVVLDYGWYMGTLGIPVHSRNEVDGAFDIGKLRDAMERKSNAEQKYVQLVDEGGVYKQPAKFYRYTSTNDWNANIGGMCVGEPFSVKKGDIIDVEILITEIPGGFFSAGVLIEEVGMNYAKKDPQSGSPIIGLFRTNDTLPDFEPTPQKQAPPFDGERSLVWKVAPTHRMKPVKDEPRLIEL